MNVLNRKLFRNKDARRALSEMGGIVSFANGGDVEALPMYIINVPGFTQPGEYLKINQDTLMLLNDTVPQLMSLRDTMVQPVENLETEALYNARPGDAVVRTRLNRRPGMTTAESDLEGNLLPPEPMSTASESLMDRLRRTVQSAGSVTPFEAISNIDMTTPISDSVMGPNPEMGMSSVIANAAQKAKDKIAPVESGDLAAEIAADKAIAEATFPTEEFANAAAEKAADEAIAKATSPITEATDKSIDTNQEVLVDAVTKNEPKTAADLLQKTIQLKMRPETGTVRANALENLTESKEDVKEDVKEKPQSDKDRLEAKHKELADLFGLKTDKKADMYELMAMIGFAMAAGEDPSALKNIADAFLIGAQIRREDRKDDEEFDQKLKLLAFESLEDERSADRALKQKLADEKRSEQRQLRIYAEKLKIKEKLDPTSPLGKYLGSEVGDTMLTAYFDVQNDEYINAEDKATAFLKRVGPDLADEFFRITGFPSDGYTMDTGTDTDTDRDAMKKKLFGGT